MHTPITIVGGGVAGLVASIACAESGAGDVVVVEAHDRLGGRAVTSAGPWRANLGPHALYTNTGLWAWLAERRLVPPVVAPRLTGLRFRWKGRVRATAPGAVVRSLTSARRLADAPADRSFRDWARTVMPEAGVAAASSAAGVLTFHHDPGELSAAFVGERIRRILLHPRPVARYVVGGWSVLIDALAEAARARGVRIETGMRLSELPAGGPAIVATSLAGARRLTGDASLVAPGTRTILLDVGVERRRRDPGIVFDLDDAAFANRYSDRDPGLAPDGHELIQAQLGARPGESLAEGVARLESLLDAGFGDWRAREVWRRRSLVEDQSGAVDRPGTTWRDRPAIDRGGDVFLCGDQVAAPGHLAEVSWASALEAARLAVAAAAVGVGARG